MTKVIDTLTQEDFHGTFERLLERYKCIAAGGDCFEGDMSFMFVLSIKVPILKKSGNFFNIARICIYQGVFTCIYICLQYIVQVLEILFSRLVVFFTYTTQDPFYDHYDNMYTQTDGLF